jgi:hypothetical protein
VTTVRVVLCVLAVLAVAACGEEAPRIVTLESLAFEADELDGVLVMTSGVVREFDETEALEHHIVIEDAAQNRVELQPVELAEPHIDERVSVVGRFSFDEETGRRLEVERIERTGP